MSKTIDERVVSMQFDNKQFEAGVQTSLSTIDKLKQSLKFKDASKGLSNVSAAAKKCDLSPIGASAEKVGIKFSAMYSMADQAFRNMYNSATRYAKRIVSAFTVDPIKTGFSEYETQINAVQTILANTQSKGTTLDDVNRALDTLNAYADKTIYNFTEMTRNIGTFTAAGVDLNTSVNAIQGIANLAAISGSNAQQASTAMYQLSQALASGTVKLMDWNSVVNAGMGGQVFQDALKETARVHGIAIDDMIKEQGSFRETLQEGWLTSEILTETLMKFTLTTEGLTEAQIAQNREMLKGLGYSDQQIEEIFKLGKTATDAATKVKTFTQLMDTLKEAAQSGWTQTWELIVGDFEQSKTLWTTVSDTLGKIIGDSANARNELLAGALGSNWDRLNSKIKEAGIPAELFSSKLNAALEANGYSVKSLIDEYGSLENAFKSGKVSSEVFKEALKSIGKTSADLSKITRNLKIGDTGEDVKQLQQWLTDLGVDIGKEGVDGIIGPHTEAAIKRFQKAHGLAVTGIVDTKTLDAMNKSMSGLSKATGLLTKHLGGMIDEIDKLGGRELLLDSFKNIWEGLKSIFGPLKEAFREVFPPMTSEKLYGLIEGFHKLTEGFKLNEEQSTKLKNTFKGVFTVFKTLGSIIGGALKVGFKAFSKVLGFVGNIALDLGSKLGKAVEKAKEWFKAFSESPETKDKISKLKNELKELTEGLGNRFRLGAENFKNFISSIKKMDFSLSGIKATLSDFWTNVLKPFFTNVDGSTIFDGLISAIKNLWGTVNTKLEGVGIKFGEIGTKISNFFAGIKDFLGKNFGGIVAFASLASIFYLFKQLIDVMAMFGKPLEVLENVGDVIEGIGKSIKAFNRNLNAEAMKSMAVAVAILAGSMLMLAQIPEDKLAQSAAGILLCAGILAGLMFAGSKLNGSTAELGKLALSMAGISASLLLFAAAATVISMVPVGGLLKAGAMLAAFLIVIKVLSKMTSGMDGKNIGRFGAMMFALSLALINMSVAIGILGAMKSETLTQGLSAIGALLVGIAGMMWATKLLAPTLPKFGTTMLALSASLLLMSAAVGILGSMKPETIKQGLSAVGALLLGFAVMMWATKLLDRDMPKFGAAMSGIGFGLLAMSAAVGVLGTMDRETVKQGLKGVRALLLDFVVMMAATRLLTKNSVNAAKVGAMILAFAASITLLTGSILLLSLLDIGALGKATIAIGAIGGVFAGLMYITKFAKVGKGTKTTIIAMTAAIGVMALSLAALSFIKFEKLYSAVGALVAVMGALSLMMFTTKFIPAKTAGKLIMLSGIVAILGGIMYLLADMPGAGNVLGIATGLSALILSLSASCVLLGKLTAAPGGIKNALAGVGILALALSAVLGIVSYFVVTGVNYLPTIGKKLSEFMTELQPFLTGLKGIDSNVVTSMANLFGAVAAIGGAAAGFGFVNWVSGGRASEALGSFIQWIKDVVPIVKEFAIELSAEGLDINTKNLDAVIGAVKTLSEAAGAAPAIQGGFVWSKWIAGGAISIPQLELAKNWIKEVVPIVRDIAKDVSVKGYSVNITNLNAIIDAVTKLAEAAAKAPSVNVAGGAFKSKWVSGGGGVISWPMLKKSADWIKEVGGVVSGWAVDTPGTNINVGNLNAIVDAAVKLAEAAARAPTFNIAAGGFGSKWGGGGAVVISSPMLVEAAKWISDIKDPITKLAEVVSTGTLKTLNTANLKAIVQAAVDLTTATQSIPKFTAGLVAGGGVPGFGFLGGFVSTSMLKEAAQWIADIKTPIGDLAKAVAGKDAPKVDTAKLAAIVDAAAKLATASGQIPKQTWGILGGGGVPGFGFLGGFKSVPMLKEAAQWITDIKDPVLEFVKAIDSGETVGEIDTTKLDAIIDATVKLTEASGKIPKKTAGAGLFGSIFGTIGGGGFYSAADFDGVSGWITAVKDPILKFVEAVSSIGEGPKLTDENIGAFNALVGAAATFAEASGKIPKKSVIKGGFLSVFGAGNFEIMEAADFTAAVDWIDDVREPILKLADAVSGEDYSINSENLGSICDAVVDLSNAAAVIPKTGGLAGSFKGNTAFSEFIEFLGGLGPSLGTLSETLSKANINTEVVSKVATAGKVLAEMAAVIPEEGGFFSIFTGETGWDTFETNIVTFGKAMVAFSNALTEADIAINTDAITKVSSAGRAIAQMLQTLSIINAENALNDLKNDLPEYCAAIAEAMLGFSQNLEGIELGQATKASTIVEQMANVMKTLSGFDYSSVDVYSFEGKLGAIAKTLNNFAKSDLLDVDPSKAIENIKSLTTMLSEIGATSSSDVTAFKEALTDLGSTSIQGLINAFNAGTPNVIAAVNSMLSMTASSALLGATALTSTFNTIATMCVANLMSSRASFASVGGYLVMGFASGITANTFFATAAAVAMAQAALAAAREVLKINSPSKVFMGVGKSVPEGFAMGITSLGGMIKSSVNTMASTAIDSASKAIGRIADTINSDIDSQPTIRPIVDLSGVKTGTAAINSMFDLNPAIGTVARANSINSMMNSRQNRVNNSDIVSAIKDLENKIGNSSGDTYNVDGVTYDDGSNIATTVGELIRAVKVERRI
ncbi:peptidoglycan-binding protein [Fibrobacter sp.]|uniref:peptidoglycan-binding protein n=1 Tax=Fibrobacter sp. TaxID=35828 RepID=UPI0038906F75